MVQQHPLLVVILLLPLLLALVAASPARGPAPRRAAPASGLP
jgi:hypothetical protein